MDIELVLGSAVATASDRRRPYTTAPSTAIIPAPREVYTLDFAKRAIQLWVIDFDKVSPFIFTRNDPDKKLVPALLGNFPHYPRPDVDEDLWSEFSAVYLEASSLILEQKNEKNSILALPERFLDKVVKTMKDHVNWDPEQEISFKK